MVSLIREDNDSHEHDVNITKTVSIIIPTKNSANTIGKCLESIKQQTYKNIEILVMDSFSADNTAEIASRFNVQIFFLDGERAKAKNLGQSKAAGEFLLFMDSDMILQPDVVEECIRTCSDNDKIAAIIIPERSIGERVLGEGQRFRKNSIFRLKN